MWILTSAMSALFAGIAVIFQKQGSACGRAAAMSAISNTAMLAVVALTALLSGAIRQLPDMTRESWLLSILSGAVQAASWIAYFAGLRRANVGAFMALDKVNIIATMLFAYLLVGESIKPAYFAGAALILAGTFAALGKGGSKENSARGRGWIAWGILSPSLQALSTVIAKLDTCAVSTELTTTMRELVVVVVLWVMALATRSMPDKSAVSRRELGSLLSGGAAIGVSYLFMYSAIASGPASAVTAIVKAGTLVSAVFAAIFLHERSTRLQVAGMLAVFAGTVMFAL